MRRAPSSGAPAPGTRSALGAAIGTVGVVGVVSLLVVWAASIGPDQVVRGGRAARGTLTPTPSASSDGGLQQGPSQEFVPSDHPIITTLFIVLVVGMAMVLAWVLFLLARALVGSIQLPRPSPAPAPVDFDVVEAPRMVEALAAGSADQRAALLTGTPRNGIVECWHRFELESTSLGVPKRPWETSAEFTLRILDLVDADPRAVSVLAGLYREARFSTHEVDEAGRERALAALDTIHRGLLMPPGKVRP